jgi:hypothetical protein
MRGFRASARKQSDCEEGGSRPRQSETHARLRRNNGATLWQCWSTKDISFSPSLVHGLVFNLAIEASEDDEILKLRALGVIVVRGNHDVKRCSLLPLVDRVQRFRLNNSRKISLLANPGLWEVKGIQNSESQSSLLGVYPWNICLGIARRGMIANSAK